ncbi:unnamed protein product [Parajaminaea phylloscopi]
MEANNEPVSSTGDQEVVGVETASSQPEVQPQPADGSSGTTFTHMVEDDATPSEPNERAANVAQPTVQTDASEAEVRDGDGDGHADADADAESESTPPPPPPAIKTEPVESAPLPASGPPQDPRLARLAKPAPAPAPVPVPVAVKSETSEEPIQPAAHAVPAQEATPAPTPTPAPEDKTAPLQSQAHKQEALDQVNTFLASVQQEAKTAAAASTAPAPPVDLSTPAARRAHLLARIEEEPRNAEAWLTLLADSESRLAEGSPDWDVEQVRQTYEKFLEVYPNAARQWQAYIDFELGLSNFAQVEQLFTRCLQSTPSVSLWRSYLSYTRRVNPLPPPNTNGDEEGERGQVRKLIEGAYEFATRHVGSSRDSSEIWADYLRFVKEREAKTPWLSGQKMDDLRRIYQRVVGIPVANVEQIWREYDQFENGLNRVTAKKFLAEHSPAYMTARSALREMRGLVDPLQRPLLPRLPAWVASDCPLDADVVRDRERLQGWKTYLEWEEADPLELGESHRDELLKRIDVAYSKATMHMRFYPEIWFMASKWSERMGNTDEALRWLQQGRKANPGSYLLSFALLELLEARQTTTTTTTTEAADIFDGLLSHVNAKIERLNAGTDEALAKIDAAAAQARAQALAAKRAGGEADELEGEEREEERKREEQRDAEKEALRAGDRPKVEALKEEASLVWIKWMHFVRRTEGLRPTRAIFSKARKSPHCTWQVYEASALMEYHCSKDAGVATKVFELALKTFGSDEAFVVRYLDFLISINDENNARALFQRTITTFAEPERARPVWDRWAQYEYNFGDSASIRKLEARLAEAFPSEPALKRLVDRASYMDLEIVGPRDLGLPSAFGAGRGATAADRAVDAAKTQGSVAAAAASTAAAAMPAAKIPTGPRDAMIAANAAAVAAAIKRPADDPSRGSPSVPDFAKRARNDVPTGPAAGTGAGAGAGTGIPTGPAAGTGPPAIPTGPANPLRRGPLPPQNASFGAAASTPSMAPVERPLHDAILFFLSILPSVRSFDGPRLAVDDVLGAVKQANIPMQQQQQQQQQGFGIGMGNAGPPAGPSGAGMGNRRGGGRGGGGMGMQMGRGGRRF